jgi:hypothetical protein
MGLCGSWGREDDQCRPVLSLGVSIVSLRPGNTPPPNIPASCITLVHYSTQAQADWVSAQLHHHPNHVDALCRHLDAWTERR